MSIRCYLSLGANLGDASATLQTASAALRKLPNTRLEAVSSLYRTAPIASSGPDYVNAVVAITTTLPPLDLLHAVQAIELAHGRERPYHNAPRTLDIDILLYGDQRIDLTSLQVPHPRMLERAFVLVPLAEIAPPSLPLIGDLSTYLARAGIQAQAIEKVKG